MPELETVDLVGVDLMAAGCRVHGKGSPPEGDVYAEAELEAIAAANNELVGELRAPLKLGHSTQQRILTGSGLYADGQVVEDAQGQPATGWQENFRVEDGKLRADWRRVPKKLAELIPTAFRTRSVELASYTSGTTGKTYPNVISATALLGATRPAFGSLDDVHALFLDQAADEDADVRIVAYAASEVWPETGSLEWLRCQVREALNPGPDTGQLERYWVRDIATDKALVQEGYDGDDTAWVVPFTISDQGVTLAPASEWVLAEQTWVAASREMAAGNDQPPAADSGGRMPDTKDITRSFADALGVEGEATADQLLERAKAIVAELEQAKTTAAAAAAAATESERSFAERITALEADATAGKTAAEELRVMRRERLFEEVVREHRVTPAEVTDELRADYDKAPEVVERMLRGRPALDALSREFGSDASLTDAQLASEDALSLDAGAAA